MAAWLMTPAIPPLPETWNLPFQLPTGNQTSNATAGSVTPATRQIDGTESAMSVPGGVNAPAGTISALRIVVSGRSSARRLSHGLAVTGAAVSSRAPATTARAVCLQM